MKISYSKKKLERILTNERLIKKHYTPYYQKLQNRLSELRAANNLAEIPHIPPPRRHKLVGNYENCWGIDVAKNVRIVLKPNHENTKIDAAIINHVEIIKIEDYH
ncbi:type II toxin-antitoxin system RelE/ParE family toxin [Virgibacillus sp. NKC19-3]|uniref:type II toxin-antitoxin system RelE/ParE family toxin n=1 Tax=Virgibacillus saliphilus TaxID=2831674 RepID=UPI001C9B53BF|nr:type II toxin-antitoxin system RelE/ParE family toxin [Virgibacillus sp. NKC19-3]MBY7144593.1 type II toxin-antitoxin system RelE/ParE family toxin [Virgibacillus sp. NKC19-3]